MLLFPNIGIISGPHKHLYLAFYILVGINGGRIEINGMYMCGLRNHSTESGSHANQWRLQAENRAVLSWNSLGTLKSSPAVAVA